MSESRPSTRKVYYGPDGNRLLSMESMRRRRNLWKKSREAALRGESRYNESTQRGKKRKMGDQSSVPCTAPSGSRDVVDDCTAVEGFVEEQRLSDSSRGTKQRVAIPINVHSEAGSEMWYEDNEGQNTRNEPAFVPLGEIDAEATVTRFDDELFDDLTRDRASGEASSDDDFETPLPSCRTRTGDVDAEVESGGQSSKDEFTSPIAAASSSAAPCAAADVPDFDYKDFNVNTVRDFITGGGDTVMFRESNLRVWQVVLIILGICHRYSMSVKGRRALIEAARLFAGPEFASWDISDYEISKVFDPPDQVIKYHFYCEVCFTELEKPTTRRRFMNHEAVCERCLKNYNLSMNSPNCFIHFDLRYQITSFLRLPIIAQGLCDHFKTIDSKINIVNGPITDVYDSLLYKNIVAEANESRRILTYIFNTDGAPLFNSSKRSFWPIQLIVNELPPKLRFKYPLLVGLSIAKKEPSPTVMNTFLESFVNEANELGRTEGIEVNMGELGKVRFMLKPLACSVDSVARPILQNRLQFNGYHGCSWCYALGAHVHGCMRFLMEEREPLDRTHEDYLRDCEAVLKKIQTAPLRKKGKAINVRGVKGPSVLQKLKGLDMIWGFTRDYLHGDLSGTVSQMTTMWSDADCPIRLSKKEFEEVNKRLMGMTPPHEVHRLVRPLLTEKAKWKASEWRSWLLFYSVPCLSGILDNYALQHYALLVKSIYRLLQTSITEEDLRSIEYDLKKFVIIFELIYGEKYVTFNVHSLKHLVRSVRYSGPLWATSTFPFESAIRNLKGFVHGPKGVHEQMAKRAIEGNILHSVVDEMEESPAAYNFHKSLYGRCEVASFGQSKEGVVLIGRGYEVHKDTFGICEEEVDEINPVLSFKRCIKSGTVVNTVAYDEHKKTNNTMFRDKRGIFVQVLDLLYRKNTAFAKVSCFRSRKVVILNLQGGRQSDYNESGPIIIDDVIVDHLFIIDEVEYCKTVVPVVDLENKCVLMKVNGKTYVSTLPNTIEVQ